MIHSAFHPHDVLLASDLLITFANSLDKDQENVGPDLETNPLTLRLCACKNFLKQLILKKVHRRQQKHEKLECAVDGAPSPIPTLKFLTPQHP